VRLRDVLQWSAPGAEAPVHRVGDPAPPPLPARPESDVTRSWRGEEPVVSVSCATYQHAGFIEDALRGFLGQDTDFPFEILVRDDASTDGTADIVRDYAQRYPNIIRAVLETKNGWPAVRPSAILRPMVRGEFIAICEGDDYWIASDKIQRQVEQLRHRPDCAVSHHQALVVQDGRVTSTEHLQRSGACDLTALELARGSRLLTLSMLYRAVPSIPRSPAHIQNGDVYLRARLGLIGGAAFLPGPPSAVYRRHLGGVWSSRDAESKRLELAKSCRYIAQNFADDDRPDLAAWWESRSREWADVTSRRGRATTPWRRLRRSASGGIERL
jgi:glycosyltransferase involved in cell wall biosynthesis